MCFFSHYCTTAGRHRLRQKRARKNLIGKKQKEEEILEDLKNIDDDQGSSSSSSARKKNPVQRRRFFVREKVKAIFALSLRLRKKTASCITPNPHPPRLFALKSFERKAWKSHICLQIFQSQLSRVAKESHFVQVYENGG